ncbi:hypothetical protein BV25DRAFT_1992584, partial [Artomyces pyxidatus]
MDTPRTSEKRGSVEQGGGPSRRRRYDEESNGLDTSTSFTPVRHRFDANADAGASTDDGPGLYTQAHRTGGSSVEDRGLADHGHGLGPGLLVPVWSSPSTGLTGPVSVDVVNQWYQFTEVIPSSAEFARYTASFQRPCLVFDHTALSVLLRDYVAWQPEDFREVAAHHRVHVARSWTRERTVTQLT